MVWQWYFFCKSFHECRDFALAADRSQAGRRKLDDETVRDALVGRRYREGQIATTGARWGGVSRWRRAGGVCFGGGKAGWMDVWMGEEEKEGDIVGERQQRLHTWAGLVARRYNLEEGQA